MDQLKYSIITSLHTFEERDSEIHMYATTSPKITDVELRRGDAKFRFEVVIDDDIGYAELTENNGYSESFEHDFIVRLIQELIL